MSLDDVLTVTEEDKVPICGALTLFTGPVETDIRTLCNLMISISDNTATNRLFDHCTAEGVREGFCSMGLERTALRRKLYDEVSSAAGIQNTICPREIGMLLERLYRKEFISPEISQQALDLLEIQGVE